MATATKTKANKAHSDGKATKATAAEKNGKAKATKTDRAPRTFDPNRLGRPFVAILSVLKAASKGLTRSQIAEKTGINSGFTSLLGHLDTSKQEPQSLSARGFIRAETHDVKGKDVILWTITANGKKALENAKKAAK